jgi:hypothetical protein
VALALALRNRGERDPGGATRWIVLLLLSFSIAAGSVWMLTLTEETFEPSRKVPSLGAAHGIGIAGLVLAGSCAAVFLWRLLARGRGGHSRETTAR